MINSFYFTHCEHESYLKHTLTAKQQKSAPNQLERALCSTAKPRSAEQELTSLLIRLQRPLQHKQRPLDVVLIQDIRQSHLIHAHAGRRVEAGGGSHHNGFAGAARGSFLVLPAEFAQAPGAEMFSILYRQLCHRVEGAHRHRGIASRNAIYSINQAFTALDILVVDVAGVLFRSFDGGLGDHLTDKWRREPRLAELHHRLAHLLVLRDECADADAALGIALGNGVDEHDILLDPLQMHGGNIRRSRVNELAINLVGEQVQVIFLDQIPDPVHLLLCIQITRGIIRIADQDSLRALVNQLLELLDLGQAEALLDGRDDRPDHGTRGDRKGHVVRVGWLGDDDLVARVQAAQESEKDCLAAAGGDDDVVGGELDLVAVVVLNKCLAQRAIALRRAILERGPVDVLERLQRLRRRRQIRLADVQFVDLHAPVLGRVGQGRQLPDWRSRHIHTALGNEKSVVRFHT